MAYALVQDGKIVTTNLPYVGTLPDGRRVSNFDKLDEETLKLAGWLPIIDDGPPEYDLLTQAVSRRNVVEDDRILVEYDIYEIPPPMIPEPPAPTEVEKLRAEVTTLQGLTESQLTDTLMLYDILINNGLV